MLGIDTVAATGSEFGDFYRPLAPGTYQAQVAKEGYQTLVVNVTIPQDGSGSEQRFVLHKLATSKRARVDTHSSTDAPSLEQRAAPPHTHSRSTLLLLVLLGAAVLQGCAGRLCVGPRAACMHQTLAPSLPNPVVVQAVADTPSDVASTAPRLTLLSPAGAELCCELLLRVCADGQMRVVLHAKLALALQGRRSSTRWAGGGARAAPPPTTGVQLTWVMDRSSVE